MSTPAPNPARPDTADLRIHNARAEIDAAEEQLLMSMERHGYGDAARFAVRLAFE